jgi:ADP-heptose:LPS heptosyltransferase
MGIINAADYFIGCDSVGQHIAYALKKPSTIVVGATFPENITYPECPYFSIIDNGKDKRKYSPIRITMDESGDRINENLMILSSSMFSKVIESVNTKLAGNARLKIPKVGVQSILPPFAKKNKLT